MDLRLPMPDSLRCRLTHSTPALLACAAYTGHLVGAWFASSYESAKSFMLRLTTVLIWANYRSRLAPLTYRADMSVSIRTGLRGVGVHVSYALDSLHAEWL